MSLDNVLARSQAPRTGTCCWSRSASAMSVPIVIVGSSVLAALMSRYPAIIWVGGGVLGYVAGRHDARRTPWSSGASGSGGSRARISAPSGPGRRPHDDGLVARASSPPEERGMTGARGSGVLGAARRHRPDRHLACRRQRPRDRARGPRAAAAPAAPRAHLGHRGSRGPPRRLHRGREPAPSIPLLQLGGGLALIWIAVQARPPRHRRATRARGTARRSGEAIWIIVVADVTMSLDNVLGVAAAAPRATWSSSSSASRCRCRSSSGAAGSSARSWPATSGSSGSEAAVLGYRCRGDDDQRPHRGALARPRGRRDADQWLIDRARRVSVLGLGWWLARAAARRQPPARAGISAMDLEPVKSVRIYEDIVRQVRALIADGHLKSGDRLPPGRDLAERFPRQQNLAIRN